IANFVNQYGYSNFVSYLGFTHSQLDLSFFQKLNLSGLISYISGTLDNYASNTLGLGDFLLNDKTRNVVNNFFTYFYGKYKNDQDTCMQLINAFRANPNRTKALWLLSDNLWSTTTKNSEVINLINKIATIASGIT